MIIAQINTSESNFQEAINELKEEPEADDGMSGMIIGAIGLGIAGIVLGAISLAKKK